MWSISQSLAVVTLLAVALVLFMGIRAMTAGGPENAQESDRMMRWRVLLQAVAILLLLAGAIYLF